MWDNKPKIDFTTSVGKIDQKFRWFVSCVHKCTEIRIAIIIIGEGLKKERKSIQRPANAHIVQFVTNIVSAIVQMPTSSNLQSFGTICCIPYQRTSTSTQTCARTLKSVIIVIVPRCLRAVYFRWGNSHRAISGRRILAIRFYWCNYSIIACRVFHLFIFFRCRFRSV